eukprot:TRINITY_DN10359_c0_g1_i1.p1 TRINITY_DN10359_c0_g1~~TRINITY_DN10359_c0_g1_i1.p1  ORF type:complete len:940 (+),score=33.75 TRINITY_DN10359_c0_g1_i1:398-2821(+)
MVVEQTCFGYLRQDSWFYVSIEPAKHPSILVWLGVQSQRLCPSSVLYPIPAVVYNGFYACIACIIVTALLAFLLLCRLAVKTWQAEWWCRRSSSMFHWVAELWNEFPSLFDSLPPSLHHLVSSRIVERRTARFRILLLAFALVGPPGTSWTLVQYILPKFMAQSCQMFQTHMHSPRAFQVAALDWQRTVCMELVVLLYLTWCGLYTAYRPRFLTSRTIAGVTIIAHTGMAWHLLETHQPLDFKEWFQTNYVFLRVLLCAASGRVRLTLLLSICLCICECCFWSTMANSTAGIRFSLVSTLGIIGVAVGFEYLSIRDVIGHFVAQSANAEASQARSILDTLCDAVVVLKDSVISEACPKLATLLLVGPSAHGLLGRPFLECVADDDQDRVRNRIAESEKADEAAFIVHTTLQSSGSNTVEVQLCVNSFQDLYGNTCHILGIREDGMQEDGRVDNLPTQLPPLETGTSNSSPALRCGMEDSGSHASRRSSLSVSSGTRSADGMLDLLVDTPQDATPGTATVWLDCAEPGRYRILMYDRTFTSHLGLSLGVTDFTELFARPLSPAQFQVFMDAPLNSTVSTSLRPQHWQVGLRVKVIIRLVSFPDAGQSDTPSERVARLELSNFRYVDKKVNKPTILPKWLPLGRTTSRRLTVRDQVEMLNDRAASATSMTAGRVATLSNALKRTSPVLTSGVFITPDETRSKMVQNLLRSWQLADASPDVCCDMHWQLALLASVMKDLFEAGCSGAFKMPEAWQCEACGCLHNNCTIMCGLCLDGDAEEDKNVCLQPDNDLEAQRSVLEEVASDTRLTL